MLVMSFSGTNREFREWLAARTANEVDLLQRCELCGRLTVPAEGPICLLCDLMLF